MHPVNFIAQHIKKDLSDRLVPCDTICAVTGINIDKGHPVKKYISGTFTDYHILRYKSEYISEDVLKCTGDKMVELLDKMANLRNYSFLATNKELKLLNRYEVYELLLDPPQNSPFILGLSYNNKKHISTNSRINYSATNFFLTTDTDGLVKVEQKVLDEVCPILQNWYAGIKNDKGEIKTYFTKTEIQTGIVNPKKIEFYGSAKFISENFILQKYRETKLFNILIYCIKAQELQNA